MSEDAEPGVPMRIVVELRREGETVSGALITAGASVRFWGWLELMSALELAAGSGHSASSRRTAPGGARPATKAVPTAN